MSPPLDATPGRGEIFSLLSNHRRRYAIHICKREEEPVTLGDLAEQIAAWELDKEITQINSDERKRVYTSLQQTHLPTLADAGMITFENGEVALTDRADDLDVYLDIVPGNSVPWGTYYLGLSGFGISVLAGLWLDLLPTDSISALGWATIVIALFAVSAVVHVYQTRNLRLGDVEMPP